MLLRDLHVVYSVSTIRVMVWRFVYSVSTSRVLVSKLGGALPQGCVARTTGVQTGLALKKTLVTYSTTQTFELLHNTKDWIAVTRFLSTEMKT